MSLAWSRALVAAKCGNCGVRIVAGEPLYTITARYPYAGKFRRCAVCAGEAVPELPPMPSPQIVPFGGFTTVRGSAAKVFQELDYTNRRLGEREPGEDDV